MWLAKAACITSKPRTAFMKVWGGEVAEKSENDSSGLEPETVWKGTLFHREPSFPLSSVIGSCKQTSVYMNEFLD
jgi:hypothetical protein